jgi:hypothetical protein
MADGAGALGQGPRPTRDLDLDGPTMARRLNHRLLLYVLIAERPHEPRAEKARIVLFSLHNACLFGTSVSMRMLGSELRRQCITLLLNTPIRVDIEDLDILLQALDSEDLFRLER